MHQSKSSSHHKISKGFFDHSVFDAMKGNNATSPANRQRRSECFQKTTQLSQLIVYFNSQSLKQYCSSSFSYAKLSEKMTKSLCRSKSFFQSLLHNPQSNFMRFLGSKISIIHENTSQLIHRIGLQNRRCSLLLCTIKSHIQRPIIVNRKSSRSIFKMFSIDADIEQYKIYIRNILSKIRI